MSNKNVVLIITGRYLPGYKDGGPVRSIRNLVDWLGDRYDIRIMCLDRDHGDTKPYSDIRMDEWNFVGQAKVWYVENFDARTIAKLSEEADVVYCCGPYSDYAIATMRLKKNGMIKAPLYVASMGSFSPEAFALKGRKKQVFVKIMRCLGMFKKVIWSVTSEREQEELRAVIGSDAKCVIASDLPREGVTRHTGEKVKDSIRLIFLSRIARKKNLSFVPEILKQVESKYNVLIDIYGIAEDEEYLGECQQLFDQLPESVKWEYKGEVDSEKVPEIFASYDAFIFPTLGENYGHVIAESLAAGCIPIISDKTPWMDLDAHGCGYVCNLEDSSEFAGVINNLAAMSNEEYNVLIHKSYDYIKKVNETSVTNSGYKIIFDLAYDN